MIATLRRTSASPSQFRISASACMVRPSRRRSVSQQSETPAPVSTLGRASLNPFRVDRRVVGKSRVSVCNHPATDRLIERYEQNFAFAAEAHGATLRVPRRNVEGNVLGAD